MNSEQIVLCPLRGKGDYFYTMMVGDQRRWPPYTEKLRREANQHSTQQPVTPWKEQPQ